jgi:hypothetical protein
VGFGEGEAMTRWQAAFAAALLALPAHAQVDGGQWFHEQVRRQQSTGGIGAPPVVAPPTITGPGALYHDDVRTRQQRGPGLAAPRRLEPQTSVLEETTRGAIVRRPPDPVAGSSGRRLRAQPTDPRRMERRQRGSQAIDRRAAPRRSAE